MDPRLAAIAATNHGVFTRREALHLGYTSSEIDLAVKRGLWSAVRRGIYVDAATLDAARSDARELHLIRCAAAIASTTVPAYLSHRSAAIAWRIPLVGVTPTTPVLTTERQHRRRAPAVELHTAATPMGHRCTHDGLPVTTVARTLSDLARVVHLPAAVAAADSALHEGLCDVTDVMSVIADCPTWPGIARIKRVLEVVDRRAESPGESLSRVAMIAARLPAPEPQVELLLGGRHVRVDFMWAGQRVVGEFDGRVKYGRAEDLWREKQREDLIRQHGHTVVRWTWDEVYPSAERMVAKLRVALTR